jgi:hypothetical protein
MSTSSTTASSPMLSLPEVAHLMSEQYHHFLSQSLNDLVKDNRRRDDTIITMLDPPLQLPDLFPPILPLSEFDPVDDPPDKRPTWDHPQTLSMFSMTMKYDVLGVGMIDKSLETVTRSSSLVLPPLRIPSAFVPLTCL